MTDHDDEVEPEIFLEGDMSLEDMPPLAQQLIAGLLGGTIIGPPRKEVVRGLADEITRQLDEVGLPQGEVYAALALVERSLRVEGQRVAPSIVDEADLLVNNILEENFEEHKKTCESCAKEEGLKEQVQEAHKTVALGLGSEVASQIFCGLPEGPFHGKGHDYQLAIDIADAVHRWQVRRASQSDDSAGGEPKAE